MIRRKILSSGVLVGACVALLFFLGVVMFAVSFHWPWLNVTLRRSAELSDVYDRCSRILLGQGLEDVTSLMQGLRMLDHLAGDRSISFYAEKHSADWCRVQFSIEDPPRVTRVDFLVD